MIEEIKTTEELPTFELSRWQNKFLDTVIRFNISMMDSVFRNWLANNIKKLKPEECIAFIDSVIARISIMEDLKDENKTRYFEILAAKRANLISTSDNENFISTQVTGLLEKMNSINEFCTIIRDVLNELDPKSASEFHRLLINEIYDRKLPSEITAYILDRLYSLVFINIPYLKNRKLTPRGPALES